MTIKKILIIINFSIMALLIIFSIISTNIAVYNHNQLIMFKTKSNMMQQTLKQYENEAKEKQKLIDKKNKMLKELSGAVTIKDFIKIWEKIKDARNN